MGGDDLNDFFDNLFGGGGGEFTPPPPPTDEELYDECMSSTRVHLEAFKAGSESTKPSAEFFRMLPAWQEELEFYLPKLEEYEEYERCAEVFKAIREIKSIRANLAINQSLNELDIEVYHEGELDDSNDTTDEPDF